VFRKIYLEPATVIEVPAMAMFSDTKYASLSYEMTGTYLFSHSMSFSIQNPSFTVGYSSTTSETLVENTVFQVAPNHQMKIVHRHYAATCWWAGLSTNPPSSPTLTTGNAGKDDKSWRWDLLDTTEYLDPNSTLVINNHEERRLDAGGAITESYTEQGSYTWSASLGVPFGIQYLDFGATIDLDVTVTSTSSSTVQYTIDRTSDTNTNRLYFWAYTSGVPINIPDNGKGTGGMEIHVWDMSGAW
jgi:hypothetical protein